MQAAIRYNGAEKGDQMKAIVPIEVIERKIYLIRRQKVMLDSDLAELYGVETKASNGR